MPLKIAETQSKAAYMADFYVVPVVILACLIMSTLYDVAPMFGRLDWLVAGALSWVAFEYALHRWFLHGPYKKQHWLHHIRPHGYISVGSGFTFASFAVTWLFVSSIDFALGQMWFAGFYAGYFGYRFTHHALHQWTPERLMASRHMRPLFLAHELHHTGKPCNFGVQTLVLDKLFGTFAES